jgi:hypothetical protein
VENPGHRSSCEPLRVSQEREGLAYQRQGTAFAVLGFVQRDYFSTEVDLPPMQPHDFRLPCASRQSQHYGQIFSFDLATLSHGFFSSQ